MYQFVDRPLATLDPGDEVLLGLGAVDEPRHGGSFLDTDEGAGTCSVPAPSSFVRS